METNIGNAQTVRLTSAAVEAVKGMIVRKKLGNVALRLGVEGGGCSGLTYQLKFDTEVSPHDESYEFEGLRVLVDKKSLLYLTGITLDFSKDLVGGGFKFINPNAKQSCGCGESFSA
ncbi:MAG: HesB/IscA family protein [Nitrospiria bacterium]